MRPHAHRFGAFDIDQAVVDEQRLLPASGRAVGMARSINA